MLEERITPSAIHIFIMLNLLTIKRKLKVKKKVKQDYIQYSNRYIILFIINLSHIKNLESFFIIN